MERARLTEAWRDRAIALWLCLAVVCASPIAIGAEVEAKVPEDVVTTAEPEGDAESAVAETASEDTGPERLSDVTLPEAEDQAETANEIADAEDGEADPAEGEYDDGAPLELGSLEDGDEAIMFQEIPSVYGVSRFEQSISEAPSFVTLITADEIAKYGHRTLADALASVTGFFTTYDRNYHRLGVRGFNRPGDFNSRVLVLVDGHRANDNLYDQGGIGTEAIIDVDLIDRIEVIRGPSSSLYGTNAFFGVVNVITKRGRDIRGAEVSGEVGSFDTYRGRGTYGDRFSNGIEVLLSGSYYESQGQEVLFYEEFDDPSTGNGITRDADDDQFPSFFGKLSFRDFTLQGGFTSREKGIPTAAYETVFPTDETRSVDEHAYAFLKYEHQFDTVNVFGRVYYDRFYYKGDYLYETEVPPPDTVLNRDKSTGEWWGFELKADRRFFDRANVTAGIEYRDNFRQDLWNADTDPTIKLLDDERDSKNVAVFLQNEFEILDDLILNAGVRYDYYDTFGSTVNPRIALIYNWDKTTFKALYGTAFRGPNAYERFYEGTGFKGNPDLDAEEIATYELVVEHSITPWLRATASGYFYQIEDLISQELDEDDDLLFFDNRDDVDALGLEMQLEMDNGPLGISGRLGYAFQEARDNSTDKRLTNSPSHLLNLNATVPIWKDKFFGGFELLYASERKTLAGDNADDNVIVNWTFFTKNLLRGLEVSATVRNLFDEKYSDPGSGEQEQDLILQDGRSFWLKVKYGFHGF